MKQIIGEVNSSIEVKKSLFLSFIVPYIHFGEKMKKIKKQHSKAAHFVYAYRLWEDNKIIERFSDDGEPKGSSGMPILNVLRGKKLLNCVVIVVRYFGGTLLGIGGLVRAYTQSVMECIKDAQKQGLFCDFLIEENLEIECDYAIFGRIQYLVKTLKLTIQKKYFHATGVRLLITGERENLIQLKKQYQEICF